MDGKSLRLANKYAQAFLNWQGDQFDESNFWSVLHARQFLVVHPSIANYLSWPTVGMRVKLIKIFLERFSLPVGCIKLLDVLYRHRRMHLLQHVLHCLIEQYLIKNRQAYFELESYPALTQDQTTKLIYSLESRLGLKILYREWVNPELIAGLRMSSTQWRWEDSISGKLRAIQKELIR